MDLYEYFDCRNGEELLSLIESNSPKVESLTAFFDEIMSGNLTMNNQQVDSLGRFISFLEIEGCSPLENQFLVCLTNSNLDITSYKQFPINKEDPESVIQDVNQYLIDGNGFRGFITFPAENYYFGVGEYIADEVEKSFDIFGLELKDKVLVSESTLLSQSALYIAQPEISIKKESFRKSKDGSLLEKEYKITSPNLSKTQAEIKNFNKYNEFVDYFIRKNIVGLDAVKDELKIQNLLKLLLFDKKNEQIFRIDYNNDCKVEKMDLVTIGAENKIFINKLDMLSNLAKNDKIAGISVVHNHPSGKTLTIV